MVINERTLEWARHYRHGAQQNQRSGLSDSSMPTITEIDDMMCYHQRAMYAMEKVKDEMIAQQHVPLDYSREQSK